MLMSILYACYMLYIITVKTKFTDNYDSFVIHRCAVLINTLLIGIATVCNSRREMFAVRLELRGGRITASAISGVLRMLGHCTDDISM